jgi:hypothetical protein
MPEANKVIDILQIELSFGRVIREIQAHFRCSEIAHLYNKGQGSYNSNDGMFESTAMMINVVFYLFVYLFIHSFSI